MRFSSLQISSPTSISTALGGSPPLSSCLMHMSDDSACGPSFSTQEDEAEIVVLVSSKHAYPRTSNNYRGNASAATLYTLPTELIIKIIRRIQHRPSADHISGLIEGPVTPTLNTSWTALFSVNVRLRTMGINSPELWTCIDLNWSLELIELFTQRAQHLPLTIFGCEASPKSAASWMRSYQAIAMRAQTIAVLNRNDNAPIQLFEALSNTSRLKTLHLTLGAHSAEILCESFSSFAENLTTLSLHSAVVDVLPSLPALLTLKLHNVLMQTLSDLVTILAALPSVQDVEIDAMRWVDDFLENSKRHTPDDVLERDGRRCPSRKFQRLRICDLPRVVFAVLRVLPYPLRILDVEVSLRGFMWISEYAHTFSTLSHAAGRSLPQSCLPPIAVELITCRGYQQPHYMRAHGQSHDHTFTFISHILLDDGVYVMSEHMHTLLQSITVWRMDKLPCTFAELLQSPRWSHFLDGLHLKHIYISHYANDWLLSGLIAWIEGRIQPIEKVVFQDQEYRSLARNVAQKLQECGVCEVIWQEPVYT
jgi:hypothetical protein